MNLNSTKITIRQFVSGFLLALASSLRANTVTNSHPTPTKGKWIKLHEEPVRIGDFFVCNDMDPNTPELQNGNGSYNLQMQAVNTSHYGKPAKNIPRGNGNYWRLIDLVSSE